MGAFIIWFLWIQSGPMGLWAVEMIGNFTEEGNTITEFLEDRVHYLRGISLWVASVLLHGDEVYTWRHPAGKKQRTIINHR